MKISKPLIILFIQFTLLNSMQRPNYMPEEAESNYSQNGVVLLECYDPETARDSQTKDANDLSPDDIILPTRWISSPDEACDISKFESKNIFEERGSRIRRRLFYRPEHVKDNKLICCIVVHGTKSNGEEGYYRDSHKEFKDGSKVKKLENQNFRHMKRFAAWYSTLKKRNLDLLSLKWTGSVFGDKRTDAAFFLKELIEETEEYKEGDIVTIAHSHGANVVNCFSNIVNIDKPIALLIHFGCPRKEEIHYQPKNYKILLYFFSDSDWWTIAGRDHLKAGLVLGVGGVATAGLGAGGAVIGFKVGAAADLVGADMVIKTAARVVTMPVPIPAGMVGIIHPTIVPLPLVPMAIKAVSKMPPGCSGKVIGTTVGAAAGVAVGAAATGAAFRFAMDGTNEFPVVAHKITIGFRIKLNAYNARHATLVDVMQVLPEIIEKLMINYPYNYSKSSKFHLNIDTENKLEDPVFLVLFPTAEPSHLPDTMDYLVLNSDKEEVEVDDYFSRKQMEKESDFSESEEKRYINTYKKYGPMDIKKNYKADMAFFK